MKAFVCNNLMNTKLLLRLKIVPEHIELAETTGKLFTILHQPVLFREEWMLGKTQRKVFGAILTYPDKQSRRVLNILDAFHSCSYSRNQVGNPNDITQRTTLNVHPIAFNTLHEFSYHKYTKEPTTINCNAWVANQSNVLITKQSKDMHKFLSDGVMINEFIALWKEIRNNDY